MILFFDIDGVLNRHKPLPSGVCGIDADLRDNFNSIIDAHPTIDLVIHSAWRYLITHNCPKQGRSSMTTDGMAYLLQTHGIKTYDHARNAHRLIGHTAPDVYTEGTVDRPERIIQWLLENCRGGPFAIIDDLALNWDGPEFFHCPSGLTPEIAAAIIKHLEVPA